MNYMQLKEANRILNNEEVLKGNLYLKSKPLFFWFDLAGPCNLECKHCGFHMDGRTSDQEVSDDVYQTVVSELLPTAFVCNLGGTNWGEMTIAKRFHPFLLDCKAHGVKVSLTTNGTRMSDEWFDDMLDTLSVIGFSMEGMEDQFENMRGFKWRFFLKHVEKVCRGRADRGKDFRVEWRFCAHSDNIHQLPDMIRLAKSIGVDRIQVMNLVPYMVSQKYKMLSYHRSLANQFFVEGRRVARELNFNIEIPPDFSTGTFDNNLIQLGIAKRPAQNGEGQLAAASVSPKDAPQPEPLAANGSFEPPPKKHSFFQTINTQMVNCYYPWQTCSINELGNVKPCCVYWRSMGNMKGNGFASVWNGRKYRGLRKSVNRKPDHICYTCRLPRFDNEENKSAAQLMPGMREIVRNLFTIKRRKVTFDGILNEEYDPNQKNVAEPAKTY